MPRLKKHLEKLLYLTYGKNVLLELENVISSFSVQLTFVDRVGAKKIVKANIDDTLLDVAKDYDIDGIEGEPLNKLFELSLLSALFS